MTPFRIMYKGLAPHKIMPMPGTHKGLLRTRFPRHRGRSLEANMDLQHLNDNGFAVIPGFTSAEAVAGLKRAVDSHIQGISKAGVRGIVHKSPEVSEFARSSGITGLVETVLGRNARLVRSIIFNKTPDANWLVTWHQDLTIPVEAKAELPGFRGWSTKAGVCHVQPPVDILESMITFRVHLDDTGAENGALVVAPGTHKLGRISAKEVSKVATERQERICSVQAGDALLFRPLLAHCSKKAVRPGSRRIIHLEFCAADLPPPLRWAMAA